jgi:hypothetical protein
MILYGNKKRNDPHTHWKMGDFKQLERRENEDWNADIIKGTVRQNFGSAFYHGGTGVGQEANRCWF